MTDDPQLAAAPQADADSRAGIVRRYGEKTLNALTEIVRITDISARFAARGETWYRSDPDNSPGLACESLIIKLGENVSRVSAEFERDHPHVPWRVIKDMRDRLAHYYEATDHQVVWDTICHDLPDVRRLVLEILG